jgi:ribonuclease T1
LLNGTLSVQALELFALLLYHSGFRIQGKPVFVSGGPLAWRPARRLGLAIAVVGALLVSGSAFASRSVPEIGTVSLSALPREAQAIDALIRAGGPFANGKDGTVFGNRERVLPAEPRGYYREYTVMTPGARDRGARRIVCGGRKPTSPEACYYTADHYASFRRIVQ